MPIRLVDHLFQFVSFMESIPYCFTAVNLYNGDHRLYSRCVMPLTHMLYPNAENSHILAVRAAHYGIVPRIKDDPLTKSYLGTNLWNIDFENPIGLAAGFDKDGEAINGLSYLGFGFLELGSTTPEPQTGNISARVFRLPQDRAIINRYGFNSAGHEKMFDNLKLNEQIINDRNIVIGVNLGKNRTSMDATLDYIKGLRKFYHLNSVKYFVINISSPNTPKLRDIQNKNELSSLLDQVLREKLILEKCTQTQKPLLLKLAPDLSDTQMRDIAEIVIKYSKHGKDHSCIDGLIISNTTTQRPPDLKSEPKLVAEAGGLSGPPLRQLSTNAIKKMYILTKGSVPIVGVGGIQSGMDAYEKIIAGASLVQLYTSMAYTGPQIVRKVKFELAEILAQNGFHNVREAVGRDMKFNN